MPSNKTARRKPAATLPEPIIGSENALKSADIDRSRKPLRSRPQSRLQLLRILDESDFFRFNGVYCDDCAAAAIFDHSLREIIRSEP
jgi:hypothetical protein